MTHPGLRNGHDYLTVVTCEINSIDDPIFEVVFESLKEDFPQITKDKIEFVHHEGFTYIYPVFNQSR